MLIKFTVENFLSFNGKKEFSMITGKSRSHTSHVYNSSNLSLLKSSYIYGANASGKTNFIKSLNFAKKCILNGMASVNTLEKNYKLDEDSLNRPTQFEFEILIEDKIYAYGFSFFLKTKEILEEWLVEVGKKEDINIFTRNKNVVKNTLNLTDTDKVRLNVYLDDLESNSLLLETLNKKKWEKDDYEFLKILKWFAENLIIIFPNTTNYVIEYFENTDNWVEYLKVFDIGITEICFGEREFEELPIPKELKSKISNDMATLVSDKDDTKKVVIGLGDNFLNLYLDDNKLKAKEIIFKHKGLEKEVEFKFYEESDGTKRLLELLPLLEKVKCHNQTILIDELERSLHPVLVKEFLRRFYKNMEKTNSQLIITTHESRLLDLDTIRRDEVWFAENTIEEGTNLYSLEEFKTRFDLKLDKAYLLGRYGGIPQIKTLFEEDIECDN
ncbi:ATP/GTP-binding protein [Fusobacterium sp.]|uniref:AAA family ATPase n=1 Tax=Fusobacterium sp. TaxID=68766 RepID=UPI0026023CD0|nr:ATP-binding protein [Fusobacterium sp.]